MGEQSQGAAGLNCGQLHRVAEQPYEDTGLLRESEKATQRRRASHSGLVDQAHIAGA
jgi:hypothetical protein